MGKNWTILKNNFISLVFSISFFQLVYTNPFITVQPNVKSYTIQFWFHAYELPFQDSQYKCIARFPFSFLIKTKSEQFPYYYFNETITLYLNEHDDYPDGLEWIPYELQIPFKPVASILIWKWKNIRDSVTIFPNFHEPSPFSLSLLIPYYSFRNPFYAFSIPLVSANDTLRLLFKGETNHQLPQFITIHLLQKQFDPLNPIETYYGLYSQNYRLPSPTSYLLQLPLMNLEEGHYLLLITYIDHNFKEQVYGQYPIYIVNWNWKALKQTFFQCYSPFTFPKILGIEEIESYIEQINDCISS